MHLERRKQDRSSAFSLSFPWNSNLEQCHKWKQRTKAKFIELFALTIMESKSCVVASTYPKVWEKSQNSQVLRYMNSCRGYRSIGSRYLVFTHCHGEPQLLLNHRDKILETPLSVDVKRKNNNNKQFKESSSEFSVPKPNQYTKGMCNVVHRRATCSGGNRMLKEQWLYQPCLVECKDQDPNP